MAGGRFGSPYVMQVSRDVLSEDLQTRMLKEMAATVKPDVLSTAQEVRMGGGGVRMKGEFWSSLGLRAGCSR